jgi:hypothetical protein
LTEEFEELLALEGLLGEALLKLKEDLEVQGIEMLVDASPE